MATKKSKVNPIRKIKLAALKIPKETTSITIESGYEYDPKTAHSIEELHKDLYFDDDAFCYEFKDKRELYFNFTLNKLPACCGIAELGEISLNKGFDSKGIAWILEVLIRKCPGKIMINTNGNSECRELEKTLESTSLFTLVDTFINKNSRNTIKIWISNN